MEAAAPAVPTRSQRPIEEAARRIAYQVTGLSKMAAARFALHQADLMAPEERVYNQRAEPVKGVVLTEAVRPVLSTQDSSSTCNVEQTSVLRPSTTRPSKESVCLVPMVVTPQPTADHVMFLPLAVQSIPSS